MNQLSTELSAYKITFKDKDRKPLYVTKETGEGIIYQRSRKEFITIEQDGVVYGETWNDINVTPLDNLDMRERPIYCWGEVPIGTKKINGKMISIYEVRKMLVSDFSVIESWKGYITDYSKVFTAQNFPYNFTILS